MNIRTTEIFRRNHFPRRGLHQRRATEKDRALIFDDDGFVRHRRDVSAARRT